ncbi:uncharacterized protein LOC100375732 [Saccoglossus kowalevskii]
MSEKLRQVARIYLKILHSFYSLYKMLKIQLPAKSIRLESSMSHLGIFFENLNAVPDLQLTPDIENKLRELRVRLEEIGRLIFAVGMNDSSMVGDIMTGQRVALEEKAKEFAVLRKNFFNAAARRTINPAAQQLIKNEDAQIIWEECFGSSRQVQLTAFYSKIKEILGKEPPCTMDDLRPFFGSDMVDLKSFNVFVNIGNANHVYALNDQILVGHGKSVTSFLSLQRRLGHLHTPLLRHRDAQRTEQKTSRKKPSTEVTTTIASASNWNPQPQTDRWSWIRSKVTRWINQTTELSKYFYGRCDRQDVDAGLHNDTPGTFLVRFGDRPHETNQLCVSFVHVMPYKQDNSWKEWFMRKHVPVHQMIHYGYVESMSEPITWEEGLTHRHNVCRYLVFREFEKFLAACTMAENINWSEFEMRS